MVVRTKVKTKAGTGSPAQVRMSGDSMCGTESVAGELRVEFDL